MIAHDEIPITMRAAGFLSLLDLLAADEDATGVRVVEGKDESSADGTRTGVATVVDTTFSHVQDPVSVTVVPPELSVRVHDDPLQSTVTTMLLIGPKAQLLLASHVVIIDSLVNVAVQPGEFQVILKLHLELPIMAWLLGPMLHPEEAVIVI